MLGGLVLNVAAAAPQTPPSEAVGASASHAGQFGKLRESSIFDSGAFEYDAYFQASVAEEVVSSHYQTLSSTSGSRLSRCLS